MIWRTSNSCPICANSLYLIIVWDFVHHYQVQAKLRYWKLSCTLVCLKSQPDPFLSMADKTRFLSLFWCQLCSLNMEECRGPFSFNWWQHSIDSDPEWPRTCQGRGAEGWAYWSAVSVWGHTGVLSLWPSCRHEVTTRPQAPVTLVIVVSEVPLSSAVGPLQNAGGSTPLGWTSTVEDVCLRTIDSCWCAANVCLKL